MLMKIMVKVSFVLWRCGIYKRKSRIDDSACFGDHKNVMVPFVFLERHCVRTKSSHLFIMVRYDRFLY